MNTEETDFRDEKTLFNEDGYQSNTTSEGTPPELPQKNGTWKTVVIGGVTGLVFGSGATILTSMALPGDGQASEPSPEDQPVVNQDPSIEQSTSVSDDMSFADAFATARAEVGPGGTFQWHGQLYNTYTAEEWNQLGHDQQVEYTGHFTVIDDQPEQPETPEVAIIDGSEIIEPEPDPEAAPGGEIIDGPEDYEVEILGVVHDNESGMNTGFMTIEDQPLVFVDIDGDEVFDFAAADINGDGEIDNDEIVDISDQGITVDHLGGYVDPSTLADNNDDGPDYINDAEIDA